MRLKQLLATAGLAFSFSLCFSLSAKAAGGATIDEAAALTIGGPTESSSMKKNNNIHWYKCTIPDDIGNQWVTFICKNNMNQQVDFALYDDSDIEQPLESFDADTNESWTLNCKLPDRIENEDLRTLEPGKTYYIKAESDISGSVSGKYSVQVKSVSDDNWGTFEQAPEFSIGKKTSGTLEMYGDIDMYKFTVPDIPEGKELTYTLSLAGSYYCEAAIIDADETEKDSLSGSYEKFSDSREFTFYEGEGGTYYLKISADTNEDAPKTTYSFKLVKGASSEKLTAPSSGDNSSGDNSSGDDSDSSAKRKIPDITVQAKKSASIIYIVSLKGAKYVVTLNRKIIKNGKKTVKKITKTNVTSGTLKINLSKKLKKGDTVKVTVSKSGFKTKSKTTKVK